MAINTDEKPIFEADSDDSPDPDEIPIRDRKVITQSYDLVVRSLIDQISNNTIFLRPLSERPNFQRQYVWSDVLASRLIESILLNVPIPPCYLSQNDDYELDVIDGQQRLYSIYRFMDNQFSLTGLEVLTELNGKRFHKIPPQNKRQLETHTLRCVLITNESHPEIKFDVFQRLNTNTVPLNAQELRNCVYRGSLNALLQVTSATPDWLKILRRSAPDKRLRDEELILRFFAFCVHGIESYKTPQKHWLNEAAKAGMKYTDAEIETLHDTWLAMLRTTRVWFDSEECFRRPGSRVVNKALFDLVAQSAAKVPDVEKARELRAAVRDVYYRLLQDEEFGDLISRAVDHTKRTKRRFAIWNGAIGELIP
jgi:hypothetical protein